MIKLRMIMMRKNTSIFLCGIIIFAFTSAYAQTKYKTYSNARFGYSISYPSNLLDPQGEAENGDGQKFLAKDGSAEMLVYGGYQAYPEDTLKKRYREAVEELGVGATYKVAKSNWFVVSGKKDGKIVYVKTILNKDIFLTFRIEYDETKRKTYDTVTTRIVKSFVG